MSTTNPIDPSKTKALVIGAGPQGLCALKNLLDEGFDATLFEQRDCIGGLWAYTDDTRFTTVLESTLLNVSKYKNCYSDFPYRDDDSAYLNQKGFLRYLEDYVKAFDLRPKIRFCSKVVKITRTRGEDSRWDVAVKNVFSDSEVGEEKVSTFDKIVFATGAYLQSETPNIQGIELFRGTRLHCSAYKKASEFRDRNVVIVGLGSTAADIACELAGFAKSVHISHRRGTYVFPRVVKGKPADLSLNHRLAAITNTMFNVSPKRTASLFDTMMEKIEQSAHEIDPAWGLKPAASKITCQITITENLVPNLASGKIKSTPYIARVVDEKTIEMTDGSQVEADAIIFCTGYRRSPPPIYDENGEADEDFEARDIGQKGLNLYRLYQNIFPPAYADSLAFMDCWRIGTGICDAADVEAMAIAQIWKGGFELPSEAEMRREVDAHHRWVNMMFENEPAAAIKAVNEGKWRAWLNAAAGTGVNEKLGYGIQGWLFWITQPRFCNLLMTGIDSPHVMRLFDGRRKKWDGARDAIIAVNQDLEKRFGTKDEKKVV